MCPYLHIGSDEVYIADPKGFMEFTEGLCKKHGRIAMAWDPGLPADSTTIRQIWNTAAGSNAASAKKGGRYVDSFMGYLNYYDPIYFTNKTFLHRACAQEVPDTTNALGGILCLWNDVRVDDKSRIALHNGMINGMMTFAISPSQKWNEPEKYAFHFNTWAKPEEELPYTDEQFYWMREPVTIHLKKGDNEVKLYIPKTFKGQRWSFAFITL